MEAAGADHFSYGIAFLILLSLAGLVVLVVLTTASEEPTPKASGKVYLARNQHGRPPLTPSTTLSGNTHRWQGGTGTVGRVCAVGETKTRFPL
jgi:hypothetical protein